jgi:hypothetical protein
MTNGPQGPGWWQASDGNWYPPAQQPNYAAPPAPAGPAFAPQQQHVAAQPSEGIAVTAHQIGINLWYLKPKLFVDGSEFPARWGRTVVPASPGQHQVHVHVPFLRQIGPADTVVQVQPGGLAEIEYRAPAWQWGRGSLGVAPQPFNGVGITVALYLGSGVLALLSGLLAHRPVSFLLAIILIGSGVAVLVQSMSKPSAARPANQQAALAANWYPDPNDPTLMRYFDGQAWTSHTAPRR